MNRRAFIATLAAVPLAPMLLEAATPAPIVWKSKMWYQPAPTFVLESINGIKVSDISEPLFSCVNQLLPWKVPIRPVAPIKSTGDIDER